MAPYTLHVPAEQVEAILEALTGRRLGLQDEVAFTEKRIEEGHTFPGGDAGFVEHLAAIEALLAQVAWDERRSDEPVELSADRDVLVDIVFSAVLAECESFPELGAARVEELDLDRVDERAQVLLGLVRLLRETRADV